MKRSDWLLSIIVLSDIATFFFQILFVLSKWDVFCIFTAMLKSTFESIDPGPEVNNSSTLIGKVQMFDESHNVSKDLTLAQHPRKEA